MLVMPAGIVMLARAEQSLKTSVPMLVILVGSEMSLSATQPEKAESSIFVTPSGILTLIRLLQSAKTELLMINRLSGIVMFVRLLQLEKA